MEQLTRPGSSDQSPLSGHNIVISDILLRQHHIYCRGYKQKTGELGQKLYKCWRYKSQYKRRIIEFIVWIFPEEQSIIWRGLPEYSVLVENECLFIIL